MHGAVREDTGVVFAIVAVEIGTGGGRRDGRVSSEGEVTGIVADGEDFRTVADQIDETIVIEGLGIERRDTAGERGQVAGFEFAV